MDVKSNANTIPISDKHAECEPERQEKSRTSSLLYTLLSGGIALAVGFLCEPTAVAFGARPFGISLLCASDRSVLALYAGLCLSAARSDDRLLLIGLYSSLLLCRLLARLVLERSERAGASHRDIDSLFSEHLALRVCTACLGALALGLFRLFDGGFLFYDLYGTILTILLCAFSVLLMGGIFCRSAVGVYRYVGGLLTLLVTVSLSLDGWRFYGISLSVLAVMSATLAITRKYGALLGALSGTVLGLTVSVPLAPAFAFAALVAGLLFSLSRALALGAALSVSLAWGGYVEGLALLNGTLAALLCATVLFCAIDRFFLSDPTKTAVQSISDEPSHRCEPIPQDAIDNLRLQGVKCAVERLSESLSTLSDTLFSFGKRMQAPTLLDLRQICERTFDASCASCSERGICRGERYHDTSAEIGSLCTRLRHGGKLEHADAPSTLRERCVRLPDIVDEINHRAALHQKLLLQNDRTEIFATDYRALAELLARTVKESEADISYDYTLNDALCDEFRQAAEPLGVRQAAVFGVPRRQIRVIGDDRQVLLRHAEQITTLVRKVCPFAIELLPSEGDTAELNFTESTAFSVVCAERSLAAEQEEPYCGDTTSLFSTEDGRFCALISDGMGSGREASLTSGLCAVFLKKMIGAGICCDMALDMLNGFLRNRGSSSLHECSATVDLLSLDLLRGKASFYKCGAAPTYVFRDGNLFKIRSHTVPLGIITEPDARKLELSMSEGDVVVMVSDGVTQSKEECPWLFDLLRGAGEQASPEQLADLIVRYAKGEGYSDDVSALVIKLQKNAS